MAKRKKKSAHNNISQTNKASTAPFWLWAAVINPVSFSIGLLISIIFLVSLSQTSIPLPLETVAATPRFIPAPSPPPFPYPIPIAQTPQEPLWLSARGALMLDVQSNTLLYQKNLDAELLPASTTKIMTALVALKTYNLEDILTVTSGPESVGSKAELFEGERITVENLLYALLLNSGNDAAVTLAQNHPQGYSAFIKAMNQQAQELNLAHSHFTNASGIDSPYHYVSPRDLAKIALVAYQNDTLRPIFGTKQITINSLNGYSHDLKNTNELLGQIEGVTGIKTGTTQQAGECLVTYVDGPRPMLIVVLGSTNRFEETKNLINWASNNYTWIEPQSQTSTHIASHSAQPKL